MRSLVLVSRREPVATLVRNCVEHELKSTIVVRLARSLEDGLEVAERQSLPALLVDLELLEPPTLPRLKECFEIAPRIPVVVLADSADAEVARRALELGASDYLLVPEITARTVARLVRGAAFPDTDPAVVINNAQLHYLQELMPNPVLVFRRSDAQILYANPKVGPTFGLTSNQLLEHPIDRFLGDDGLLPFIERCFTEQGFFDDVELQVRRFDGAVRDVRASGLPISHEGTEAGLLLISDVSTTGRAEASLRTLETSLREFFEENLSGNFRATAGGRILACNRAFNQMFGFGRDVQGESWNLRQLYRSEQDYHQFIAALQERRRLDHHEAELQRLDGTRVDVIQNVVGKFDETGELREIRGYLFDVTEHKRLERQLRQSQKMEAIGLLAGGIAHDFNNLLTAITGYSELLLNQLPGTNRLRGDVEEILKAGKRAAALTKQLLAFSRKQILQPEVLHLNEVVAEMDRMLRRLIRENIDLKTHLDPDLGPVRADRGQIEQVIVNLIVNARDAMPAGGTIVLETASLDLDVPLFRQGARVAPGRYVALRIRDSGCGIEPALQSRIFEPFFTTKEEGKGSGLGLSTVYGIVKQSNGFIFVESKKDVGTTFELIMSRLQDDKSEATPAAPKPSRKLEGSETILLVEDEASVRELASLTLQMKGYRLLVAVNGEEALHLCEAHRDEIDLIVTDVVMPQMSGRELAERAMQLRPEIKVLYLSGYTDEAVGHPETSGGHLAFMSKPFTPNSLAAKVREILDRPRAPGPEPEPES